MKKSQLLELIKTVVREEQDYQQLFKHMLDKVGKSITDMSDDEKKKFFNAVDTAYKAKSEGRLKGYNEAELTDKQKQIDVDKDGEIEGSDLAALRAGKKADEAKYNFGKDSAPGEYVAYLSTTRGKKLLKTFNTGRGAKQFLSKNVNKLLYGDNVESVGIMTKKQWDEREDKYAIEGVNEVSSKEKEIYTKIEKLRVLSNSGKITGDEFLDKFMPLWKQLKGMKSESVVNEAANLKTIAMLFQNKGIRDAVRKDHADKLRKIIEDSGVSTKGVSDSELIKVVKQLTNESVNEAGTPIDFKWPKGNTSKEIEKLETEYKALIEKGSDILEKQKQLIRKEPLTGEYPWENYDKWPTKLKIEVAKLEKEFERINAKSDELGKKLFKLKGFNK